MKTYNAEFRASCRFKGGEPIKRKVSVVATDEHDAAIALEHNYENIEIIKIAELEKETES